MSNEKREGWSIPWPVIASLVALGSGLFLYNRPLNSSRPDGQPGPQMQYIGDQDVSARLWQDPFSPVWEYDRARKTVVLNRPATQPAATSPGTGASPSTQPATLAAAADPRHSVDAMASYIQGAQGDARKKGSGIIVLPVMVDGSSFPDYTESRLRVRAAVLDGLAVSGLVPTDGEHIGYFKVSPWPTASEFRAGQKSPADGATNADDKTAARPPAPVSNGIRPAAPATRPAYGDESELIVPYEVMGPRFDTPNFAGRGSIERVVVLWLRDEAFKDKPLARLSELFDRLGLKGDGQVPVKVLGPRNSTTLRALLLEAAKVGAVCPDDFPQDFTMYAATPTASDALLTYGLSLDQKVKDAIHRTGGNERLVESIFAAWAGKNKHRLVRSIATDDQTCAALVRELQSRGIDPGGGKHHVAIVSELDTFYGRALPVTFSAAALGVAGSPDSYDRLVKDDKNVWPPMGWAPLRAGAGWIHGFSYFKGIDGRLPRAPGAAPDGRSERSKASEQASILPTEPPEGLDQSDYLRRLADRLVQLDKQLRDAGEGGLAAVGVLGSDVYDRLLVLNALRRKLHGALFFTNNMDARFSLPAEWPAAHNLVIASPFGLKLHDGFQRNIAPFRDSYQTAVFAGTLLAMGRAVTEPTVRAAAAAPRVFEMGRSGPVDLSPRQEGDLQFHPLAPRVAEWWTGRRCAAVLGVTLLTLVMMAAWVRYPGTSGTPLRKKLMTRTGPAVVAAACFCVVAVYVLCGVQALVHSGDGGEPFAWFQGVSIWPTEALRLLTTLLCVHFLTRSYFLMRDNARGIVRRYFRDPVLPPHLTRLLDFDRLTRGYASEIRRAAAKQAPAEASTGLGVPGEAAPTKQPEPRLEPVEGGGKSPAKKPKMPAGAVPLPVATADGGAPAAEGGVALVDEAAPLPGGRGIVDEAPEGEQADARTGRTPSRRHLPRHTGWRKSWGWLGDRWRGMALCDRRVRDGNGRVVAQLAWQAYQEDGTLPRRVQRILPLFLLYYGAGSLVIYVWGMPRVPYRGSFSGWVDLVITLGLSVPAAIVLTMFVLDAMRLSEHFINNLSCRKGTQWPADVVRKRSRPGLREDDVSEYLNLELIARRTVVVSPLIYYPFVALLLVIVSRLSYFDDWDWPLGLVLVLGSNSLLALVAAGVMRRAAERARGEALGRLRDRQLAAMSWQKERGEALGKLIEDIGAIKTGAFAPLSHHPIVGAVLLPSSGLGIWALVELLAKSVS